MICSRRVGLPGRLPDAVLQEVEMSYDRMTWIATLLAVVCMLLSGGDAGSRVKYMLSARNVQHVTLSCFSGRLSCVSVGSPWLMAGNWQLSAADRPP